MATIGQFTKDDNGSFTGIVRTLTVNSRARLVPDEKSKDSAPDYRVFGPANAEIGAAWKKTARETGRDYLSVKLDDPSFAAPIYASLVETDGTPGSYSLIWSRRNGD